MKDEKDEIVEFSLFGKKYQISEKQRNWLFDTKISAFEESNILNLTV